MRSQHYEGTNKEREMQTAVTSVVTHRADGRCARGRGAVSYAEVVLRICK